MNRQNSSRGDQNSLRGGVNRCRRLLIAMVAGALLVVAVDAPVHAEQHGQKSMTLSARASTSSFLILRSRRAIGLCLSRMHWPTSSVVRVRRGKTEGILPGLHAALISGVSSGGMR